MLYNVFEKTNKFFQIDVQKNPEHLFEVLKKIIDFKSGYIYLSDNELCSYAPSKEYKFILSNELKIKNAPFGRIEITRDKDFNEEEKIIFKTCSSIISNLIKDTELTKIINLQLQALQEGILETNRAYKSEKVKNDFFANFSHELRTPLNAIISSSELLAEKIFGSLNYKQLEYVNDIRISGLLLLGMINDILDMAKLEAKSMKLNLTCFKLSFAVEEAANILKPLAEKKNITIIKNYNDDNEVSADYQKIQQILFNLISNAIKYTPENGKITITVENSMFKVKDNGIGIDKKYHKKIFEKFVQLDSKQNSNGLGLTITNELVKLHKGEITLSSVLGKGAEFTVKLP